MSRCICWKRESTSASVSPSCFLWILERRSRRPRKKRGCRNSQNRFEGDLSSEEGSLVVFESIKVQLPNEAIELGRLEVLTHHFLCKQIRREYNKGVSFSIPGNNVRGLFFQDGVEFIQKARRSLLYSILLCHLNRYVSNCHYNAMNTMDAETPVGTETNFYGMKKSKQL